eukprot:gene20744-6520_t
MPVLIPSFCGHATCAGLGQVIANGTAKTAKKGTPGKTASTRTSSTALTKALSTMPVTAHAKIRVQDQTANTPMKPPALAAAASSALASAPTASTRLQDQPANFPTRQRATVTGKPLPLDSDECDCNDGFEDSTQCNTCSQNVVDGGGGSSSNRCSECQVEILAA